MNRREALKRSLWITGGMLSASTLSAILAGCQPSPTQYEWTPQALTQDQADLLSELCELIIPRTDSPGARDLGVPAFVDDMVANYMKRKHRESFIQGLKQVDEEASQLHGKAFLSLEEGQQIGMLRTYDLAAFRSHEEMKGKPRDPDEIPPFLGRLKSLVFTGFFMTESGGSEFLTYDYIPGEYRGCIPLEEVGSAYLDA